MDIRTLTGELSASPQITLDDIRAVAEAGYRTLICNRPDGEAPDQPGFAEIERRAAELGLQARYLPAEPGKVSMELAAAFARLMAECPKPVLAYCRSGLRSATMWALSQAQQMPLPRIVERGAEAGFDLKGVVRRIANGGRAPVEAADATHEVVIVGGGAADTARTMGAVLPRGVRWIKSAVAAFEPERDAVVLDGCRVVKYRQLVVCPGLKLDWDAVEGLAETLGRHGVTSNYRYDLASYTWELVQGLRGGRAVFTQPPMPIKCAGAPQKAMYLSADHWRRSGVLKDIEIDFRSAAATLDAPGERTLTAVAPWLAP